MGFLSPSAPKPQPIEQAKAVRIATPADAKERFQLRRQRLTGRLGRFGTVKTGRLARRTGKATLVGEQQSLNQKLGA